MKDNRCARWAGICAGGYFAAGIGYVANALVIAVAREGELLAILALLAGASVCGLMGGIILGSSGWMHKLAVVVAGMFATMHLVGLVYLYFDGDPSATPLLKSLQWQLGTACLFVWIGVTFAALRLVNAGTLDEQAE